MSNLNRTINSLKARISEQEQQPKKELSHIAEQLSNLNRTVDDLQKQLNYNRKEFYERLDEEKQRNERIKAYNKRLSFLLAVLSIVTSVVLAVFLQYLFDTYMR